MVKPNDTDKGAIFNIDFTGKINGSTVGKLALLLKIIIGTDVYNNKIILYGCEDNGGVRDCSDRAHYTKQIGTLDLTTINYLQIISLDIRKKDTDLATVILGANAGVDIKFYPADKTKLYILMKGCSNANCDSRNDYYVGGIYSYLCKKI